MSRVMQYFGSRENADGHTTVNAAQHSAALLGKTNDFGRALRKMLEGWEAYAAAHEARYEDSIGKDYVIGEYWANVGLSIKRLLDGETGGFDCGSLAANITGAIETQGFKTDGYSLQSEGSED